MATFLFDQTIFGPVKSRRLGVSLGINLLPNNKKVCSYNCIYCECGLNGASNEKAILPTATEVRSLLEQKLSEMQQNGELPDVITFAGNGEPTLHPEFGLIIDHTIALRNLYAPKSRIAVLSNALHLSKKFVSDALLKVDDNILKLDSGIESTINSIDRPVGSFNLTKLIADLQSFKGNLTIQTLFIKGHVDGIVIDNTTPIEIEAWINALLQIKPQAVMIYTISRDTPFSTLEKVDGSTLNSIANHARQFGFEVKVSE